MHRTVQVMVPIKTENPNNGQFGNRHAATAMKNRQQEAVAACLLETRIPSYLPARVILTRVGAGHLDEHDGLRSCLKWVVDEVARWLPLPRNAKGHPEDSDPRVVWEYAQRKAPVRVYGVEIVIQPIDSTAPRPPLPPPMPDPPAQLPGFSAPRKAKVPKGLPEGARVIKGSETRLVHFPGCTALMPCQLCKFRASRR